MRWRRTPRARRRDRPERTRRRLAQLPAARACSSTSRPRQVVAIAGDRLPAAYRRRIERSATAPASSRSTGRSMGRSRGRPRPSARAATVHLGGTLDGGRGGRGRRGAPAGIRTRPFVLLVQYSRWDPSRAPRRAGDGLGVLPRAHRLDGRHDRAHRGTGRALRAGLPRPDPRLAPCAARRSWSTTTRTTSAATSTAASRTCASCSSGRSRARPVLHPARGCTCARRRLRRVAACTACAACGRAIGASSRPGVRRREPSGHPRRALARLLVREVSPRRTGKLVRFSSGEPQVMWLDPTARGEDDVHNRTHDRLGRYSEREQSSAWEQCACWGAPSR